MSDIPENVDWGWIARTLVAMQRDMQAMRDDMLVMSAVLNRLDGSVGGVIAELRAMRSQHDRLHRRVEALEERE